MTIPEIRLEVLRISASVEEYYRSTVLERANEFFEWVFKNHPHSEIDSQVIAKLNSLNHKIDIMGQNTDQALADLQAINDKLQKIGNESSATLQKVKELEEAAANNADTPPEVLAKIAEVKAQAQIVDDLVPDATEGTPE